jgi:hypothetical protein
MVAMHEKHLRKLKIRRGNDDQRKVTLFEEGELVFVKDTERVYVGDDTTLGGNKISNKYKIRPYSWWGNDRGTRDTESEEAVLTDKITNIRDYIIDINANKHLYNGLWRYNIDYLNQIKQLYPNLK